MRTPGQLELFEKQENEDLFPYWREQLRAWKNEVRLWRHSPDSTGWNMCRQDFDFARHLFCAGQMTKEEFRRWFKFNRRVQMWERQHISDQVTKALGNLEAE